MIRCLSITLYLIRFFIIRQLFKSGVPFSDIITVYCTLIRSVLEYAYPVWHFGLTLTESADLEGVQKRFLEYFFLTYITVKP